MPFSTEPYICPGSTGAFAPKTFHSFGLCAILRADGTPHMSSENSSNWLNTTATLRGKVGVPSGANGAPVLEPSRTMAL